MCCFGKKLGALLLLTMCAGFQPCFGQGGEPDTSLYQKEAGYGSLMVGTRVRVQVDDGGGDSRVVTGHFQSCQGGALVVIPDGGKGHSASFPLEHVRGLEESRGKSSNAMPGAAIGLVVGLMISFSSQTSHHQDEFLGGLSDMGDNISRGVEITVGTTLLGAIIGGVASSEDWEAVGGSSLSASLGSDRQGRVQMRVSCSF